MTRPSRFAPWWAYTVPFFVLNVLRQLLVPPGEVGDVVSIALFLATVLLVAATVTAVHRLLTMRVRSR